MWTAGEVLLCDPIQAIVSAANYSRPTGKTSITSGAFIVYLNISVSLSEGKQRVYLVNTVSLIGLLEARNHSGRTLASHSAYSTFIAHVE